MKDKLNDPDTCLLMVEGEKKAMAGTAVGLAVLGLAEVYAWTKDGKAIPDMGLVEWDGRTVYIVFDSDAATNENVQSAELALARHLIRLGAEVRVVRIPPGPPDEDGKPGKVGLDDYIVAGGNVADLLAAATEPKIADERPKVYQSADLHRPIDATRRHLSRVPDVYAMGNVLVRAAPDGKLRPVSLDALQVLASRHMRFISRKEKADGSVD